MERSLYQLCGLPETGVFSTIASRAFRLVIHTLVMSPAVLRRKSVFGRFRLRISHQLDSWAGLKISASVPVKSRPALRGKVGQLSKRKRVLCWSLYIISLWLWLISVYVVQAMGKNSFYLGEVGNASKMNLVLQVSIIIVKQCFGSNTGFLGFWFFFRV